MPQTEGDLALSSAQDAGFLTFDPKPEGTLQCWEVQALYSADVTREP